MLDQVVAIPLRLVSPECITFIPALPGGIERLGFFEEITEGMVEQLRAIHNGWAELTLE